MSINLQKQKIQEEALNAWLNNNKIGLCELSTGTGKTFVFFRSLLSMPKGSNVLFLSETTVREKTVRDDALEYFKFYGVDPFKDYKVKFALYQGAHKYSIWDYFPNCNELNTLIAMDETHDLLSTARFNFVVNSKLQSNKIPRIGLSATIDRKTLYEIQGKETTKIDLLNTFCPVIYTYSLQESIDSKSVRKLKFLVLRHQLDEKNRNVLAGIKGQRFFTTEKANNGFLDQEVKNLMFLPAKTAQEQENKKFRIIQAANRRAKFLYSLPSKLKSCKDLITKLPGRTLIFGQDSASLLDLCPNAIVSDNPNYIKDLADFKAGKTNITASNKILKQGENIPNLDNIILFAYYSKTKDFVQMCGRILRENINVGNIIIYLTQNSQEEKWFEKMTEELNEPFIYCSNITQLLKQI